MRKEIITIILLLLTTSTLFAQFIEIKEKHGRKHYKRIEDAKIKFVSTPGTFVECGDFLLYEGEYYATVSKGAQCWFKENLNVGTMINSTTGGYQQKNNEIIEKYCYDNDASNCVTYGGLYEWTEAMQYVITEGTQGICPSGWHIPTHSEWQTLKTYVNDEAVKLIDESQTMSGYTATNETDFSALFAGYRDRHYGSFYDLSDGAYIWSSTESSSSYAVNVYLDYNNSNVSFYGYSKSGGFSVRCLKD